MKLVYYSTGSAACQADTNFGFRQVGPKYTTTLTMCQDTYLVEVKVGVDLLSGVGLAMVSQLKLRGLGGSRSFLNNSA